MECDLITSINKNRESKQKNISIKLGI
jgi:hypothetical protein